MSYLAWNVHSSKIQCFKNFEVSDLLFYAIKSQLSQGALARQTNKAMVQLTLPYQKVKPDRGRSDQPLPFSFHRGNLVFWMTPPPQPAAVRVH